MDNALLDAMNRTLIESGLAPKKAAQVIDRVCETAGGQSVYIPKRPPWYDRQARDQAVRQSFTGRNVRSLCQRFGLSRTTVYRIIKR